MRSQTSSKGESGVAIPQVGRYTTLWRPLDAKAAYYAESLAVPELYKRAPLVVRRARMISPRTTASFQVACRGQTCIITEASDDDGDATATPITLDKGMKNRKYTSITAVPKPLLLSLQHFSPPSCTFSWVPRRILKHRHIKTPLCHQLFRPSLVASNFWSLRKYGIITRFSHRTLRAFDEI